MPVINYAAAVVKMITHWVGRRMPVWGWHALDWLGRVGWWAFLVSGPICYFEGLIYQWPYDNWNDEKIDYLIFYYLILLSIVIFGLFRRRRLAIEAGRFFIVFAVFPFTAWSNDVYRAGFWHYIHSDKNFVEDHCHPVKFIQDGKIYSIGFCNVDLDDTGQGLSEFVYDTSGDIKNDHDLNDITKPRKPDRKEWVDAIRKFFNDNPNETLEIADFETDRIDGDFYFLNFDDANAEGFSREYGPPPYNSKNPYGSFFYPAPEKDR